MWLVAPVVWDILVQGTYRPILAEVANRDTLAIHFTLPGNNLAISAVHGQFKPPVCRVSYLGYCWIGFSQSCPLEQRRLPYLASPLCSFKAYLEIEPTARSTSPIAMDANIQRHLNDKLYDKRKVGALEYV